MKTLVTLLKIALLATTLSFVMSCDKNNKRSSNNNTAYTYGTGIYTYSANGQCINNQNGQVVATQYCQQQYNNGYGYGSSQVSCTGNGNYFIWGSPDQMCASQPQNSAMGYGCWKSCAYMNCAGQVACPSQNTAQYQTGGQVVDSLCGYVQRVQCIQ